jgi:uncharacterized protein YacL
MIKRMTSFFRNLPKPGIYLVFPGKGHSDGEQGPEKKNGDVKILEPPGLFVDTSALIDGRIADIVSTGFMAGTLVVIEPVIRELHQVSDSKDSLKRNRGRRGLDVLNNLRKSKLIKFMIMKVSNANNEPTDSLLLTYAKKYKGRVITTDYNLNKVGKVTGVPILNVNELANMVKTVVLPGEEFMVTPLKEGKEKDQALAYLADGTMVVVKDGHGFIGKDINVKVERVYQTEAGRIIFVKSNPVA